MIPQEPIDERGQPEEELEEPSQPDREFDDAVKAKATDALNMLTSGSIEVGERTVHFVALAEAINTPSEIAIPALLRYNRAWPGSGSWRKLSSSTRILPQAADP